MQGNMKRDDASKKSGVVDNSAGGVVQMREFYRVNLSTPIEWQLLDSIGQRLDTHNGRLANLSGGGLSFKTNCEAAPGDRMHILLTDLPLIDKLDTHVTVLRSTPLPVPEEDPPAWQLACILDELTTPIRDRLISSIFAQQRLAIQKEQKEAAKHA